MSSIYFEREIEKPKQTPSSNKKTHRNMQFICFVCHYLFTFFHSLLIALEKKIVFRSFRASFSSFSSSSRRSPSYNQRNEKLKVFFFFCFIKIRWADTHLTFCQMVCHLVNVFHFYMTAQWRRDDKYKTIFSMWCWCRRDERDNCAVATAVWLSGTSAANDLGANVVRHYGG